MNAFIEKNLILFCFIALLIVFFFVPRHDPKRVVIAQEVPQVIKPLIYIGYTP